MLLSLSVDNFRGFQKFVSPQFSQFNILAGCNNSGKSSLLEAIFLMSGMTMSDMPERIADARLMQVEKAEELYHLFYGKDINRTLKISGVFSDSVEREIRLTLKMPEEGMFRRYVLPGAAEASNVELYPALTQHYRRVRPGFQVEEGDLPTLSDKDGKIKAISRRVAGESWPCVYIPSRKSLSGIEFLIRVINEKRKEYILQVLKDIDKRIVDITVNGFDVMVDVGLPNALLPIGVLGDGVIRVVNALAVADVCRGGLLCIDEIENGLHYTAMSTFWRSLVRFAKDANIQIIATTHNLEMMQRIAADTDTNDEELLSYIRLGRRDDGTIVATRLSGSAYKAQLDEGMELR